jgi:hypothetical protein
MTSRCADTWPHCSPANPRMQTSMLPSPTFPPHFTANKRQARLTRPGRCWSTCASRNTTWSTGIGNANHRALGFPDEYWPPTATPRKNDSWDASIAAFRADQKALAEVIGKADLYGKTRPGADSVLLDDLLMIADHNAYHLGELILLRRLLGAWT